MVTVLIEHYLNNDGKKYFSKWIDELELVLKEFKGFRAIKQVYKAGEESKSFLILEYEDYELLKFWTNSEQHEQLLDKLRPYMLKKQQTGIYLDYYV